MIKDRLSLYSVELDMTNFKPCFTACTEKVVWKTNIRFAFKGFASSIICAWLDDLFNPFISRFLYYREEPGRL